MPAGQEHENEQQGEGVVEMSAGAGEGARIAQLEADLAAARAEASANWDKYLRERAEMDNFRKRQERVAADRIRYEKRELLQRVLEVMDNLDRAMNFEETMDRENLHQGLRMVHWQLEELLKGEGLSTVPAVGQPFDPHVHEAIEQVESAEYPEGVVVEEVRRGYMLGDEMLRPARVKVSSGSQG
ncbi:MAG TPA: nucleotide exchange factor GrpE [Ktedonobacterales bacterium]|jgi:molecular chaperone GrpE